jgi:hypothetical protein
MVDALGSLAVQSVSLSYVSATLSLRLKPSAGDIRSRRGGWASNSRQVFASRIVRTIDLTKSFDIPEPVQAIEILPVAPSTSVT